MDLHAAKWASAARIAAGLLRIVLGWRRVGSVKFLDCQPLDLTRAPDGDTTSPAQE